MTRLNVTMLRRCTIVLAFVLGACGSTDADGPESSPVRTPEPTVPGIGSLPATVPVAVPEERDDVESDAEDTGDIEEPVVSFVPTLPVGDDGVAAEMFTERVDGNRLLVIGDSILASTATRYGNELCDALNPIGWSVAVDAEPGRLIEFGNRVADRRLQDVEEDDDFDAVIIHMGSNYGRDQDAYYEQLSDLLFKAAPRPTLLLTVTEYRPEWSEVNEVVRELGALYDNVTIVDWEQIARTPGVLSRDGLHPGQQGEAVLVEQLAVALGGLGIQEGECLPSLFTDDSAVASGSGSPADSPSGSSSSGGSSASFSSGGFSSGGSSSDSSSGGSRSSTTGSTTATSDGTSGSSDAINDDSAAPTDATAATGGTNAGGSEG